MTNNYMVHPELDGASFSFQGGKTGFLLLHGFTATTTEVRPLAERLIQEGYSVRAPLLPGHGTHPDDLNNVSWRDWQHTAENEFQLLSEHCDEVWVAGESMGGLLSLLLASKIPQIRGLLLYAPALSVRKMRAAYLLQYVMKYLNKPISKDDMLWKGYNVYPLKGVVELLKLQKEARKSLGDVTQTTLAFFSEKDKTVGLPAVGLVKEKLASSELELVILKESPHVIMLGCESEQVIEHTIWFINKKSS